MDTLDQDVANRLTIDEEAADYARQKGGVLTLRTSPRHGCCGGRVELATVDTEPPEARETYVQTEKAGLTVYVHRGLVTLNESAIHVGLDAFWLWRSLYVEGAASRM